MPKVSVYLPDDLYREARARGLSLSTLAQQAVRRSLAAEGNADWLERARQRARERAGRPHGTTTEQLMDAVREEFGQ